MTGDRRRVTFLLFDVGYRAGIVRTVVNLANHLAQHHDVEILSVLLQRDAPGFPVDDRVKIRCIEDRRKQAVRGRTAARLAKSPSKLFHVRDAMYNRVTLLTDVLLAKALISLPTGYLITTRPALHMAAARLAPKHVHVIAQEHISFPTRSTDLKESYLEVSEGFDALAALTERDKRDWEPMFAGRPTLVEAIPNALSWPRSEPAPLSDKIVVAAGRLERQKGFDRLIDAYEPVARAHPDWQLHIYGSGADNRSLQDQIARLGLQGRVLLRGRTDEMREAMVSGSIFALSSRFEGFPMVLLEAMSVGLPVVSFDCPRGPREVVSTGHNGYLVRNGDIPRFTKGLLALIEDEEARKAMGVAAFETAQAYEMEAVCRRWQDLFDRLAARPRTTSRLWREGRRWISEARAAAARAQAPDASGGSPAPPAASAQSNQPAPPPAARAGCAPRQPTATPASAAPARR